MVSYQKRRVLHFDDSYDDLQQQETRTHTTYRHFTDTPLGLHDRAGLSQAYEQKVGIYRIGNTVYVAGTRSIRGVYDDLEKP